MRALAPWRPLGELSTLRREFDDLFARFFGEEESGWLRPFEMGTAPAVESFLRGDDLVVRADLPGIDPKNVELAVEGDRLTIKGERHKVDEQKRANEFCREVSYGRFERSVALPAGIDPDTVKAEYHDGVLEVTMKAPKDFVSKKVPITVH
jgi:HSP20 family protein